jgi:hypothetical protein
VCGKQQSLFKVNSESQSVKGEQWAAATPLKSTVVWGLAGFYVVSARLVGETWAFLQVGLWH